VRRLATILGTARLVRRSISRSADKKSAKLHSKDHCHWRAGEFCKHLICREHHRLFPSSVKLKLSHQCLCEDYWFHSRVEEKPSAWLSALRLAVTREIGFEVGRSHLWIRGSLRLAS
jgi:hypothetical protein